MNEHIPHLRVVRSDGPRESYVIHEDDTGAPIEIPQPSMPCAGCQKLTDQGDLITKYRRSWWHQKCAQRDIDSGNVAAAWLALGHDLARHPRSYRTLETRAIVGALLGMVHDPDTDVHEDDEVAS